MTPRFEFADGHSIGTGGPVFVNPAGGENDGKDDDTDVFLPEGTPMRAIEEITDAAEQLRVVSLKEGELSSDLIVNGAEQRSVVIPLGHNVVVHSS
ncbi:hypothetical protein KKB64_03975 [Patescibacteria group bacterium]|nr:hypothetical protein [Patescibacteria group bacterium]MBU1472916.1 hypothetical protein [Patescibacteria group bacterium]MBU2460326.1 hypothetical protein [Patescibacteria group bacterium]MBU2544061.1 hypothetical protein [Patescibacteria group bacterium]